MSPSPNIQNVQPNIELLERVGNQTVGPGEVRATLLESESVGDASHAHPAPKTQPLHRRLSSDTWFFELLAIGFAVACLVSIAAILLAYDNSPIPSLPHSVSLNAIISVLATASKSALLFAVSAAIGQSKWSWFRRKRRLLDINSLDEAARGSLGSFKLLFTRPARSIASLGAIITLLALGFEPFLQQVLYYSTRQVPMPMNSSLASTSKASAFYPDSSSLDYITAINSAFWMDPSLFIRSATCSTGNCIWPDFQSLSWCSKCADLTSSASLDCNIDWLQSDFLLNFVNGVATNKSVVPDRNCTIYFTEGRNQSITLPVSILGTSVDDDGNTQEFNFSLPLYSVSYMNSDGANADSFGYLDVPNPALVMGLASLKFDSVQNTSAAPKSVSVDLVQQCVLTLCFNNYSIAVNQGVISNVDASTHYGHYYEDNTTTLGNSPSPTCWSPNTEPVKFTDPPIHFEDHVMLVNSTQLTFCTTSWDLPGDIASRLQIQRYAMVTEGYNTSQYAIADAGVLGSEDTYQRIQQVGLPTLVDSIAASLTKLALDQNNYTMAGSALRAESFVQVRWEWLVLPLGLAISGVVFLAIVLLSSRSHHIRVMKGSTLALLSHSLDDGVRDEIFHAGKVSEMETVAKKTYVRLKSEEKP